MIMAAKDRALRINSIKRIIDKEICLQSVECVEKAMRQLAIMYWKLQVGAGWLLLGVLWFRLVHFGTEFSADWCRFMARLWFH